VGPAVGSLPVVVVLDFFVLPVIVCRDLSVPFGDYVRAALVPLIPAAVVAGIVAGALVVLFPHPRGVTAVVEAVVVVGLSWLTMVVLLVRIDPGFRRSLGRVLARLPFGGTVG
jgi:hypothetical protein